MMLEALIPQHAPNHGTGLVRHHRPHAETTMFAVSRGDAPTGALEHAAARPAACPSSLPYPV